MARLYQVKDREFTGRGRRDERWERNTERKRPSGGKNSTRRRNVRPRSKQDVVEFMQSRFRDLEKSLKDAKVLEKLGLTEDSFERQFKRFQTRYLAKDQLDENPKLEALLGFFERSGIEKAVQQLKFDFYGFVVGQRFTQGDIENQKALADLRYPAEWFPATRVRNRTIHLHIGPTNSGKTYHALKRLEEAESGIYAGPLRLLAHEVFVRMKAKGKRCALVTGDERKYPDENFAEQPPLISSTVEMAPINRLVEVAVLDEIQMIGDPFRGWAWTEAFLGVLAAEVHLCGEARTEGLIQELCAAMGEKLIIHRYERLSPLEMMEESLDGKLSKLQKGDCVISFSVMGIHALKKEIEKSMGKNVAVIYGSLPPETRAQQARLFNDPENDYDVLVASDAVGMGLNLSIKRVIFESSQKNDGLGRDFLKIAHIKQIAGRAGRYRTINQAVQSDTAQKEFGTNEIGTQPLALDIAAPEEIRMDTKQHQNVDVPQGQSNQPVERSVGLVTTLEKFDYPHVRHAMESEPAPILSAGLQAPPHIIERFSSYFPPNTPFSYILLRLNSICQLHTRFHLCNLKDHLSIAETIEPIEGLTINDRMIFIASPVSTRTDDNRKYVQGLATAVADQKGGSILELPHIDLDLLQREPIGEREYLRELENLHKKLVSYLWLSFRFPGIYTTRALATHIKELVEERIEISLRRYSFIKTSVIRAAREQKFRRLKLENAVPFVEAGQAGERSVNIDEAERGEPFFDLDLLADDEMEIIEGSESGSKQPADVPKQIGPEESTLTNANPGVENVAVTR